MTGPTRRMATITTIGTALIAAWLAFVLIAVVPARDPDRIGVWAAIAAVTIATVAASGLYLASGTTAGRRRGAAAVAAVAALVVGGWLIAIMVTASGAVEEYVVVIGGWLVIHALASLALVARGGHAAAARSTA